MSNETKSKKTFDPIRIEHDWFDTGTAFFVQIVTIFLQFPRKADTMIASKFKKTSDFIYYGTKKQVIFPSDRNIRDKFPVRA